MAIVKDPVTGELKVVPDTATPFAVPEATTAPPAATIPTATPTTEAQQSRQMTRKEYLQQRIAELLTKYEGIESNIPVRGEDSIYWHLQNELRGL